MPNPTKVTRSRTPRQSAPLPFARRDFPKEIIKRLETVVGLSGRRPIEVYSDWVFITEATLQVLPDQLRAVGATGRFAPDPPEVADTFARVRSHYDPKSLGADRARRVWDNFAQAFALLLEATAPGLWGEPNSLSIAGISGPDILGYIFQTWAGPPSGKTRLGQVLTPYAVASCMARILNTDLERLAYDRVKEALCHPDNVLGAAVLLTSLAIPEDDPTANFEWFLNRCLPAAAPYLKPILVLEPAVGTGVIIMAHAAASPEWAVRRGIVQYRAQDIDPLLVACAASSLRLYGLNTYSLQLEAAVLETLQIQSQQHENSQAPVAPTPAQAIRDVYRNGNSPLQVDPNQASFETMFRAVAGRQPAVTAVPQG